MNFQEATKALNNGDAIRRKSWPYLIHLKRVDIHIEEETKGFAIKAYRQEVVPFNYDINIILSDDWIVIDEEDIKISFPAAIEKLKQRHKLKLPEWPNHTYLKMDLSTGKDLVMYKICEYEYLPSFECFSATDWEIME